MVHCARSESHSRRVPQHPRRSTRSLTIYFDRAACSATRLEPRFAGMVQRMAQVVRHVSEHLSSAGAYISRMLHNLACNVVMT
jgi:hypothetical protein